MPPSSAWSLLPAASVPWDDDVSPEGYACFGMPEGKIHPCPVPMSCLAHYTSLFALHYLPATPVGIILNIDDILPY
ncbi:MAG: hypothetical protein JSV13_05075 [Nitrospiraceae bacterium]|nr:MAG: hypothetical protein JSV13_05075 [Nitrospiraceae bacterium]